MGQGNLTQLHVQPYLVYHRKKVIFQYSNFKNLLVG